MANGNRLFVRLGSDNFPSSLSECELYGELGAHGIGYRVVLTVIELVTLKIMSHEEHDCHWIFGVSF